LPGADAQLTAIAALVRAGDVARAITDLQDLLETARHDRAAWRTVRSALREHALFKLLREDPIVAQANAHPHGAAGSGELLDLIYDRRPGGAVSPLGQALLAITSRLTGLAAMRDRLSDGARLLTNAWQAGRTVCVLGCGHLREAAMLIGSDLTTITAVDIDGRAIDAVRRHHGHAIEAVEANALRFLQDAIVAGRQFDLIYALGLSDALSDVALSSLCRLARACLTRDGRLVIANYVPDHASVAWMDAILDWQPIGRSTDDLSRIAVDCGYRSRCWTGGAGNIAWAEMLPT